MTVQLSYSVGDVVEFADKAKFHLGLVIAVDEKTSKIRVVNVSGRELVLPPKQIMHALGARIATQLPLSNIQNELLSIDSRATQVMPQCDVEALWQLVGQDYDEISVDDLTAYAFDAPDAVRKLAMIRTLREDKVFFKAVSPQVCAPRPENVVLDLKKQQALKAQKEAYRARFVEEAAGMLRMSEAERLQALEDGVLPSAEVIDAWKTVEQYAVLGSDAEDKAEAELLLERVQKRIDRGFAGTAHLRARAFLRECGYWAPGTNVALLKYEIPVEFSSEADEEALRIYQNSVQTDGRTDLTHLELFSIDDTDTLDIDDALSIERLENGALRLGVHIAAPAASVEFGCALEREARGRATSIYLPEQRIPMMPAILSENALSLMPMQKRNALSFMITFDADFNITHQTIVPSVVCSRHRLSYDTVESLIENGNDALSDDIRLIQEITEYSAANRRSRGAVDIDIPEYKLTFDASSGLYELHPIDTAMMSRQLVSECMILANALAAEFCDAHDIPAVYRIQPAPVNMPRQETLDELPNDLSRAYAVRRCMMPAAASLTPGLHAGLGLDKYLQATSPLRRYADLLCHYQLEHYFAHQTPRFDAEAFNTILAETDLGLSHARSASHEAYQTATLMYLKQLGNVPLEAIIVQYPSDRGDIAQVVLVETQLRATVATKGRLPIGTICTVSIDNVRPEEGAILLQFRDVVS